MGLLAAAVGVGSTAAAVRYALRRELIRSIKTEKVAVAGYHYYVRKAPAGALLRSVNGKETHLLPMWTGASPQVPIFLPTTINVRKGIVCTGVPYPKGTKLHMGKADTEHFKGQAHYVRDHHGDLHLGTSDKVVDKVVCSQQRPWLSGVLTGAIFLFVTQPLFLH